MTLQEHYRTSVTNALGGFQLVEESLKNYLELYYGSVRYLLGGRLHFDFQRSDINDAPLGRLVGVFAKTCANSDLVNELRSLIKHRDIAAHRALVCLYGTDTSDEQYHSMIRSNHALADEIQAALKGIQAELAVMQESTIGG